MHPVFLSGDRSADVPRNVILVATESAAPAKERLAENYDALREESSGAPDLAAAIRDRWERPVELGDVPVLTDDYAPTDALLLLFG